MMRNREFQHFLILFSFLASVSILLGFIINIPAGILTAFSAAVFGTVFFLFTQARYKSIAGISNEIDLVLHNADHLLISTSEEGELSILQNEIAKMTLRIREQNKELKKEKERLADSLADIAHQLKTPLTSVNLLLSLTVNSPDEAERKTLIRETEGLLFRMDSLLTSLLKLSRLDAGIVIFKKEPANVLSLLHTALRPFLITMELHNVDLQINVPEEAIIQGDPDWLVEAMQNLIKNGMESAGIYGKIEIDCTDTLLFTEISIKDNGPGFKQEDLLRLFDRFYRGKSRNDSGYGIGLALCKTIITGQGGTITAKNHIAGGAQFMIRFPK